MEQRKLRGDVRETQLKKEEDEEWYREERGKGQGLEGKGAGRAKGRREGRFWWRGKRVRGLPQEAVWLSQAGTSRPSDPHAHPLYKPRRPQRPPSIIRPMTCNYD